MNWRAFLLIEYMSICRSICTVGVKQEKTEYILSSKRGITSKRKSHKMRTLALDS